MNVIRFSQRKVVPGSLKFQAYSDVTTYEIPFEFEGEPSDALREKITLAFYNSKLTRGESSWGRLRWSRGWTLTHINFDTKTLTADHAIGLCD